MARRRQGGPSRYFLDGRLFRLLCAPGNAAALDGFRESLARQGLAPEGGGLPDLEMTALAVLDVLGVEPPPMESYPLPKKVVRENEPVLLTSSIVRLAKQSFATAPELQAESLRQRADDLKARTDPEARELFDLCVTRFVSRDGFEVVIQNFLSFDFLNRFRLPEEIRERVFTLLSAALFGSDETVSGLSKMRVIKAHWDRSYEKLLRKHPRARAEIQALDQEMKLKTFKDFLDWELVHHSVLGYAGERRTQPVVAFFAEPEERLRAHCTVYKTALRAFLDQIGREDLATTLRTRLRAWKPGVLVPCREDGTFDTLLSTGELPIF